LPCGYVLIGGNDADTAKLMFIVVDAAPAAATVVGVVHANDRLVSACGTGVGPTCAAIRRSLSQILRQKYTLKCAAACHDGLGRKFCTAGAGARADFAIDRFNRLLSGPATTCEPGAAVPSPHVGCKEVQYQCDYLHPCNILIIRAISVLISPSPFAARLASPASAAMMKPRISLFAEQERAEAAQPPHRYTARPYRACVWRFGANGQ